MDWMGHDLRSGGGSLLLLRDAGAYRHMRREEVAKDHECYWKPLDPVSARVMASQSMALQLVARLP